ncbi:hypothetical protein IJD44_02840 [bacterium]|nr:hypothetical protein [bacterium]
MSKVKISAEEYKKQILKVEKESLSNIIKTDDKTMVSKIINTFERLKNDTE